MNAQRRNLFLKTATWLIAEVILNLVGLDNLADYSEFIFDQNLAASGDRPAITTTLVFDQGNVPRLFV
ncbi:hypothetical protein [Thermocoleostomius sinensis]|uniref:Uncharacterized protein n=1 Tax=Thermocoleostomius sinensis A174 TaxID=2016057 RepID=A0A9E8ZD20_9CYAN|nr:hypothetical protein [Thermocoleostomius sinensis]WAL61044.1 hypothetical protein OXH18_03310 [Thermocoleostomius sinensis A174]